MKQHLFLILFLLLPAVADAKGNNSFVEGAFKYTVLPVLNAHQDSLVEVSSIERTERATPFLQGKTLTIPGSVVHNGYQYKVRNIATSAFAVCDDFEHVIIGEGIETINYGAFYRCSRLRSVSIPSTMTCIDCTTFNGCYSLESITVHEDNPVFDSRGDCNAIIDTQARELILGCHTTAIPPEVKSIGDGAFAGCLRLDSIAIPEGVVEIKSGAFYDCANLRHVTLPQSLTTLSGGNIFLGTGIRSIRIPRNVTSIQGAHFLGCLFLDSIVVDAGNPVYDSREGCNAIVETATSKIISGCGNSRIVNGIKEIEEDAFTNTPLPRIHIPQSVTKIHERAFDACLFCTAITVDQGNPVFDSRGNCNAIIESHTGKLVAGCAATTIPEDITEIGDYAFSHRPMPAIVYIPEGIKRIGEWAFKNCSGLDLVVIPRSMEVIEPFAFYGCSVQDISWKGHVDVIDMYAFSHCPRLHVANIPEGTKHIHSYAFKDCPRLRYVSLPSSLERIDHKAFQGSPCQEVVKEEMSGIMPAVHDENR